MAGSAFKDADVIKSLSSFTPVLVDGDTEKDVTKKYGVHGYPAMVFVDAAGEEIDRIVGYSPTAEFLKDVERIKSGEGTLPGLKKRFEAAPDDIDSGIALGARLAGSNPDAAAAIFATLAEKAATKDRATQGRVHLEYAAALFEAGKRDAAVKQAEALVKEFADTASAAQAATRVGGAFLQESPARALAFLVAVRAVAKSVPDRTSVERFTVAVHKNGIAASLKRQGEAAGDDPQALNEVAWTCFEQKLAVREALGWAKKAVTLSDRDPMILDTLANLFWLMAQRDEAIKTEEEAAGKVEGRMKGEFEANVAKWKADRDAMKASGAVPMMPLSAPPVKPPEKAPQQPADKPAEGGAK